MPLAFERSLPVSKFDTLESGKSVWDTNRAIWQDNSASTDTNRRMMSRTEIHDAEAKTTSASTSRQNSASSNRFSKTSNGSALSTIDNPRTNVHESSTIWGASNNSRQNSAFTSPTKTKSSWLFDSKGHDLENSSSLLAGSAPEFEPFGKENAQANSRSLRLSDDGLSFDTRYAPSLRSTGPSHLPAPNRAPVQNTGAVQPLSRSENYPTKPQLHGLGMDTSPTSRGAARTSPHSISPTTSRFARQMNGYLDRTGGAVEAATQAFGGLSLSKKSPIYDHFQSQGIDIDRNIFVVQDDLNQARLASVYENGSHYDGSWYDRDYVEQPNQPYTPAWSIYDNRTRHDYMPDYRNANSSYYSSSLTPTSGTESRINSGATSRSSQHELVLASRKQGAHDLYAAYANHGMVLPAGVVPLDMAVRGYGIAMNPLAPPYPYYGLPQHEVRPPPIRSALLEEFRLHKNTKRYELRDIFNHIVEFSGDQHGSRFIQQKLETANSDDKERVFQEIQPEAIQLMTDLFGNYVIQKLFDHGNQAQKAGLANCMRGHVAALSVQMYGCRVVQKALEYVLTEQQAILIKELAIGIPGVDNPTEGKKNVLKIIRDQNGNHVVQKAIERVPAEHIHFIVEAHRGDVVKLAQHTYGCRVIQRILEYCTPAAKRIILDEVHGCLAPLIVDAFGNYVVQHVIEKGEPADRRRVVETILGQLITYSKHKFASNVVEMCLQHADEDQRSRMVVTLIATPAGGDAPGQTAVLGLLRDQYGNYVIRESPILSNNSTAIKY